MEEDDAGFRGVEGVRFGRGVVKVGGEGYRGVYNVKHPAGWEVEEVRDGPPWVNGGGVAHRARSGMSSQGIVERVVGRKWGGEEREGNYGGGKRGMERKRVQSEKGCRA